MKYTSMRWIEYHDDGPDKDGKRRFTLHWIGYRIDLDAYGPKAQVHHADPSPYLECYDFKEVIG